MKENLNTLASTKTMSVLINVAQKHFTEYGFTKTSLESVCKDADVTRGALYHHFKNKEGLFKATLELVQEDVGKHVDKRASQSDDLWEQLVLGCVGFIEGATRPSNKRILLIDGPSVIDWDEWKKMDNENSVKLLLEQLVTLKNNNKLISLNEEIIAHLISGSLNEFALYIAQENLQLSTNDIREAVLYMLKGFQV